MNDQQEREALLEGASALRYRADRVIQHSLATPEDKQTAAAWKVLAAVLDEIADTYAVAP